ncbi:ArnT family glycosyltransferase [Kaistia nematophila]|uniref:Glycosyltransferase family 39 protein n=1 Tax=Kaistia nematophila TaxID=2994654 RepID=A0A9X3IJN2_9HYPH|nr:glycosyltransferase family 39 protein [Kaistia nematophila]MCX5567917.1 glycosyltransferase family 39 protein [Kaistia nematophila]
MTHRIEMHAGARPVAESRVGLLVLLLAVITLARLLALRFSVTDLQVDEAQYWDWSQHLAFGYFSKPPLIGWTIAAANMVCGTGVACVRAPSPLFYFGTSLLIYATAVRLYDHRIAFWASLGFAFAPGVAFSSAIMSTDVLLLFFWALSLYAFVRLRAGGGYRWSLLLGFALGCGLLAKYAMAYFVGCALIAAVLDPQSRAVIRSGRFWLAVAIGLLLLSPNIGWNLNNHLVTLRHTNENISGDGLKISLGNAIGFLAAQFGIIGPFLMGGAFAAAIAAWRKGVPDEDRMLLAFALPVILVVTIASVLTVTNANWAASGLVASALVGTAFLIRADRFSLVRAGLVIGIVAQVVLIAGNTIADKVKLPLLKHGDIYKQVLGWSRLGDAVRAEAKASGATMVVTLSRADAAALVYYLRNDPVAVTVWPDDPGPDNQFELTRSIVDHAPTGPALLVAGCAEAARLGPFFGGVEDKGRLTIPSGPGSSRQYQLFRLDQPIAPLRTVPLCVRDAD